MFPDPDGAQASSAAGHFAAAPTPDAASSARVAPSLPPENDPWASVAGALARRQRIRLHSDTNSSWTGQTSTVPRGVFDSSRSWRREGQSPSEVHQRQLPEHLAQIGAGEGERSVLVIDRRDQRVQSPSQDWVLDKILTNAQAAGSLAQHRLPLQHLPHEDAPSSRSWAA